MSGSWGSASRFTSSGSRLKPSYEVSNESPFRFAQGDSLIRRRSRPHAAGFTSPGPVRPARTAAFSSAVCGPVTTCFADSHATMQLAARARTGTG